MEPLGVSAGSNPVLRGARYLLGATLAFFLLIAVWRPEYLQDPSHPPWLSLVSNLAFGVLLLALLLSSWPVPGRHELYLVAKLALCLLLVIATVWPVFTGPLPRTLAAGTLFAFFWLVFPRSAGFWTWVRPPGTLAEEPEEDLAP